MKEKILKIKVERIAKEHIKYERDRLLKVCLYNDSIVGKCELERFQYLLDLENSIDDTILTNRKILHLVLNCCDNHRLYSIIENTDDLKKAIEELLYRKD